MEKFKEKVQDCGLCEGGRSVPKCGLWLLASFCEGEIGSIRTPLESVTLASSHKSHGLLRDLE